MQKNSTLTMDTTLDYTKRKRRILYLMRNYKYTDDEPLVLSK